MQSSCKAESFESFIMYSHSHQQVIEVEKLKSFYHNNQKIDPGKQAPVDTINPCLYHTLFCTYYHKFEYGPPT